MLCRLPGSAGYESYACVCQVILYVLADAGLLTSRSQAAAKPSQAAGALQTDGATQRARLALRVFADPEEGCLPQSLRTKECQPRGSSSSLRQYSSDKKEKHVIHTLCSPLCVSRKQGQRE